MTFVAPVSRYSTFLTTGLASAGAEATITVDSITLPSGESVDFTKIGDRLYLCINPGASNEEFVYVTGRTGTTFSGLVRGLSYQGDPTSSSSRALAHSAGEPVVATDYGGWFSNIFSPTADYRPQYSSSPTFGAGSELHLIPKEYADNLALAGAPNASETQKGIVEEATQAQVNAETDTGETGAQLFVAPSKLAGYLETVSPASFFTAIADEDLTAGQPVGISNYKSTTRVSRAIRYNPSVAVSVATDTDLTRPATSCALGGDKFVFITVQNSDDSLYAVVGSVDPDTNTVSLGTPVAATADINSGIQAIVKVDTDKFIVFYIEDASTTLLKYRVGTVSGTTITFGSAATFHTGATAVVRVYGDYISAGKGVLFVGCNTVTDSRLIAFTVSGTTATAGTPKAIGTTVDNNTNGAIKTISTDKFILATESGYAQVGTCSGGTTITLGSEVQFTTTTLGGQPMTIVSPASDVAVIVASDSSSVADLTAGTISGTTPTFGTPLVGSQYYYYPYAESSSSILVGPANGGSIRKYTRSGTTLTSVGAVINPALSPPQKLLAMDNGYYVAVTANSSALQYFIEGMSNSFAGIAQSTVNAGDSVQVLFSGKDTHQSGLITGAIYTVSNGTLALTAGNSVLDTPIEAYVTALSATEILVTQ